MGLAKHNGDNSNGVASIDRLDIKSQTFRNIWEFKQYRFNFKLFYQLWMYNGSMDFEDQCTRAVWVRFTKDKIFVMFGTRVATGTIMTSQVNVVPSP